jgi:hypothetical protein
MKKESFAGRGTGDNEISSATASPASPLEIRRNKEDLEIISHNLAMIEEDGKELAGGESIGGNAGGINIDGKYYHCRALNGRADIRTGKILLFDNPQNIPLEIIEMGTEFTLREAVNFIPPDELLELFNSRPDKSQDAETFFKNFGGKQSKIVNFFGADMFSERGRKNIEAAISLYNEKYWPSQ